MAKPKNEDHVSCLADSHLAWRGKARNFSKAQRHYTRTGRNLYTTNRISFRSVLRSSRFQSLCKRESSEVFPSPRAYFEKESLKFFEVLKLCRGVNLGIFLRLFIVGGMPSYFPQYFFIFSSYFFIFSTYSFIFPTDFPESHRLGRGGGGDTQFQVPSTRKFFVSPIFYTYPGYSSKFFYVPISKGEGGG